MNPADRFAALKEYTDRTGEYYGTSERCVFLYSLIKMHRPRSVYEVGTGLAGSALWMASALAELGEGKLYVTDGGFDWGEKKWKLLRPHEIRPTHAEFFTALVERFGLSDFVEFRTARFPPFPEFSTEYDFVFTDYRHGFENILDILAHFLPRLSRTSSLFIDSAPSLSGSYLMLRELMRMFERGKVPELLMQRIPPEHLQRASLFVQSSELQFIPLVEAQRSSQNAMAWLRIQPADLMPRPLARYRTGSKEGMGNEKINSRLMRLPELGTSPRRDAPPPIEATKSPSPTAKYMCVRLKDMQFDAEALRHFFEEEVQTLPGTTYFDGDARYEGWAVTSRDGTVEDGIQRIDPKDPRAKVRGTTPTPICKGVVADVLEALRGKGLEFYRARFMQLQNRDFEMKFHVDSQTETWRLHIPVITNPESFFEWELPDGKVRRVHFPADGHAYLVRVDARHRATNNAPGDGAQRVHLLLSLAGPPPIDQIEEVELTVADASP
jgi:hypothetical protein